MRDWAKSVIRVSAPLLVHLAVSFIVAFIMIYINGLFDRSPEQVDSALLTVLSAAGTFIFLRHMWIKDRKRIPSAVEKRTRPVWFYVAVFLCGMAASCVCSYLMNLGSFKQNLSNQVQEELFASSIVIQIIGLGFIVPVAEEYLFRGLFYQRLREFIPKSYAIIIAVIIFALTHGNLIQILYAIPMALLLQLFYELSGNLLTPILFHMGANLISVLVESFR